jgi:gliding motility-associated protein GldM
MKNHKIIVISIIVALCALSCSNAQKQEGEIVVAISPTKMNVVYIGVDNPINVAVSGYDASELEVSIPENGTLEGENGKYIVKPKHPGNLFIVVKNEGEIIKESEFRVKTITNPVAMIPGKGDFYGGDISKEKLLKAGRVVAVIRNFDFDLRFDVVSFTINTTCPKTAKSFSEKSDGNKFSEKQIELIKSMDYKQKFRIEDIKVKGPDGVVRNISSAGFIIAANPR